MAEKRSSPRKLAITKKTVIKKKNTVLSKQVKISKREDPIFDQVDLALFGIRKFISSWDAEKLRPTHLMPKVHKLKDAYPKLELWQKKNRKEGRGPDFEKRLGELAQLVDELMGL